MLLRIDGSCEVCSGKGWIRTFGYYAMNPANNGWHIEKCDTCEAFSTDEEAKQHSNSLDPYADPKDFVVYHNLNSFEAAK